MAYESNRPRKINCNEAVGLLFEYLDRELAQDDEAAVEAHLRSCPACFSRMKFEKRLQRVLKYSDTESLSEALRARIKKVASTF